MSQSSLHSFLEKVSSDTTLKSKVEAAFKEKKGEEAVRELVNIASAQGFEFNTEEILKTCSAANGELSDSELDEVVGGVSFEDVIKFVRDAMERFTSNPSGIRVPMR